MAEENRHVLAPDNTEPTESLFFLSFVLIISDLCLPTKLT